MARRRYQKGSLRKRVGKTKTVWVGQWREDIVEGGAVRRIFRKEVLGTLSEYPTKKLAQRALDARLAAINSPAYRPQTRMTFAEFSAKWAASVLPMHKPSSQSSEKAHLARYIDPYFGPRVMSEVTPAVTQAFVAQLRVAPKTTRNIYATFRSMWKTAKAWGLVSHNACEGIRLPQLMPVERPAFTIEQMQQIIAAAEEPFKTFFWLAAETGMRAGELCGLRWEDVQDCTVRVRQSVWNGNVGSPKSAAGQRAIRISLQLGDHLAGRRAPDGGLLFHTRNGQPWDARFIIRDKLHRLLASLGIPKAGMHAFRHGNATHRLQQGEDVKTLAARLGHSDPGITLRVYAHASQGRELSDKMGSILMPSEAKAVRPVPQLIVTEGVVASA